MTRLEFRPEAKSDVLIAKRWYEHEQPGLGEVFAQSLAEVVNRIESMPKMYPIAHHDARRARMRKFPYLVYYRLVEDKIEIIAVLHGSRDPKLWQRRIT
jgi:plasmid stabilization system protein ParE